MMTDSASDYFQLKFLAKRGYKFIHPQVSFELDMKRRVLR